MKLKRLCIFVVFLVAQTRAKPVEVDLMIKEDIDSGHYIGSLTSLPPGAEGKELKLVCKMATSSHLGTLNDVIALNLNDAPINRFPTELFRDLPKLQKLIVNCVGLKGITQDDLKDATGLKELQIFGNDIPHLHANFFSTLSKLKILRLVCNQIETIDGAFTSQRLQILDLSVNKLKSLQPGVISGAKNLDEISLNRNSIKQFEVGTFDLRKLQTIRLEGNGLRTLPANLFEKTPNLSILFLGNNKFKKILSIAEKITNLYSLDLENNSKLDEQILQELHRLPNLEYLNLENCNVILPESETIQRHSLKTLSLANNNLSNRKLLSILKELKELKKLEVYDNEFTKLDGFGGIKKTFKNFNEASLGQNEWDLDWEESAKDVCEKKQIKCSWV